MGALDDPVHHNLDIFFLGRLGARLWRGEDEQSRRA